MGTRLKDTTYLEDWVLECVQFISISSASIGGLILSDNLPTTTAAKKSFRKRTGIFSVYPLKY